MAVDQQLRATAIMLCQEGKAERIAEFKDILADKLAQWEQPFVRATSSDSSLIQAANYLRSNSFPMNPKTYVELQDFIVFVGGLC